MTLKKEPRDANGSTPLHLSSEKGFLDVVTYFIDSGVEKEPRDADEDTPLHKAACNGRIDVVKYFLQLEGVQYFYRFLVMVAESPASLGFVHRRVRKNFCNCKIFRFSKHHDFQNFK